MPHGRTFFEFNARPQMNGRSIEVIISGGSDPANPIRMGTINMDLHEWQNMRTLLQAGMRDMRQPVGVTIHDGTVRKPKAID